MICHGSRPAEFRRMDLRRLDEMVGQFRTAEISSSYPGDVEHPARAQAATPTEPADPLGPTGPRPDTYVLPNPHGLMNERDVQSEFASDFGNMDMLSPGQLLGIASLFDQAPECSDFLDENHSWLWSN